MATMTGQISINLKLKEEGEQMSFFKLKKKELDSKSRAIARMYLDKSKFVLEKELATDEIKGENEIWTAEHDIKCLERAIDYLEH